MKSVLDVQVSRFADYNTPNNPQQVNLLHFLQSDTYKSMVQIIRIEPDKARRDSMKGKLPAITPSGTFTYRNSESLISHSGLIQFDIDFKENNQITNYALLKKQICNIKNVAYCGLSVSGTGYWGLIPIMFPEKHRQHFESLKKVFRHLGINIDEKPKNVSSLRGYSYDVEPYFNHEASVFQLYEKPKELKSSKTLLNASDDKFKVEKCIAEIARCKIDITNSYADWFDLGCSLGSAFGEEGRYYFHQISQYHPNYNIDNTDTQYSACLKGNYNYTLGTFLAYCESAGIKFKEPTTYPVKSSLAINPVPEVVKKIPVTSISNPQLDNTAKTKYRNEQSNNKLIQASTEHSKTWESQIIDLHTFFTTTAISDQQISLNACTTITDVPLFIESHFIAIQNNKGKRAYLPYLERLSQLKSILTQQTTN